MIVLRCVIDLENYSNLRVEIFDTEFKEVVFRVKHKPVSAARKRLLNQKEGLHPAVVIRPGMTQLCPGLISILNVQVNSDASGRGSARNVEYVR